MKISIDTLRVIQGGTIEWFSMINGAQNVNMQCLDVTVTSSVTGPLHAKSRYEERDKDG